jgi:hypothetical protein
MEPLKLRKDFKDNGEARNEFPRSSSSRLIQIRFGTRITGIRAAAMFAGAIILLRRGAS